MSQMPSTAIVPGQPGDSLQKLETVVEKVRFTSSNGWTVAQVRPAAASKGRQVFNAVGTIGTVKEGQRLILSGDWATSDKYGLQLKVTEFDLPSLTGEYVRDFLVGGYVKGIGEKLGELIWSTFGLSTADVFENEPEKLLSVKGIGKAKQAEVIASWNELAEQRRALVTFSKMGLNSGQIRRIFEKWETPELALQEVEANPYRLAWDISGVGFQTADTAARKLGFSDQSPERIGAALGFVLDEAAKKEGHCFLEAEDLFARANELLHLQEHSLLATALQRLRDEEKVLVERVANRQCVCLQSLARAEKGIAQQLCQRIRKVFHDRVRVDDLIDTYEAEQQITLHDAQRAAVLSAVQNEASVITGGPGTGKTTIIKALLWVLRKLSPSCGVALCAPTGRAAKRMAESTGCEAATIHRLLGFGPEGYAYDDKTPLPAGVIICDEASMLDVRLAYRLVKAVKSGSRLIFVGDVNQLPPVGAGAVLKDIIASRVMPVCTLTAIYRQSAGSFIALNAKAVLDGNFQGINLSNKTDDFFCMAVKNPKLPLEDRQNLIRQGLVDCVNRLAGLGYGVHDVQVLCPQKSGRVGVEDLNALLQQTLNPHGYVVFRGSHREFRLGDKVMQIRNDYEKDVFNGDQGTIVAGDGQEELKVDFYGREVAYKREELGDLSLSYAMTVHKAQGSETKAVIAIVSTSHYMMLSRSILYTAITRARHLCTVIGETAALKKAVSNDKVLHRNTNLAWFLQGKHI